ncbi:MAG: stage III sporulation protein AD [Christensenellales bacterium]|jgi:stage III sporulation protein AD
MLILQAAAIGIIATVLVLVLKKDRPEYAIQIGIVAGIILLLMVMGSLTRVVEFIDSLTAQYGIDAAYIGIVLKIIGIAYVAEFAALICKDAGETAIAAKVELVGKVLIVVLAIPVMHALIETIIGILPS